MWRPPAPSDSHATAWTCNQKEIVDFGREEEEKAEPGSDADKVTFAQPEVFVCMVSHSLFDHYDFNFGVWLYWAFCGFFCFVCLFLQNRLERMVGKGGGGGVGGGAWGRGGSSWTSAARE